MRTYDDEMLSDSELDEMLAAWRVPEPPRELWMKIFMRQEVIREHAQDAFDFDIAGEVTAPWYRFGGRSAGASVLVHAAALGLMLLVSQNPVVKKKIRDVTDLYYVPAYKMKVPLANERGGGGGGGRDAKPISHGAAPQFARKQFVPPALAISQPKLAVTPTITAPAPQIVADQYGDPLSKLDQTGLGRGSGTGLGNGNGDGYGPGEGHGMGGGVYRIGGDVSAPTLLSKIEPEYSEEARKAKYSGSVLLTIVVGVDGLPRDIKVVRPLGLGLDQKAIEAVAKWRFRPGMRNGRPVATVAQVEVSFRLL